LPGLESLLRHFNVLTSSSRNQKPKQLEGSSRGPIFLLSVVFALNIAIGNTSLRWVSVNFNQVFRALVPAIVMIISTLYYGKTYSSQRKLAIIPIVIGVALTFYGGRFPDLSLPPPPLPDFPDPVKI
jgi:drug/metabolite transporter (DMT)-like permease